MVRSLSGMGVLSLALAAHGQVVAGNDQPNGTMWLVDVTGVNSPRALLTGSTANVGAITADDPGETLYWTNGTTLYKATYETSGALSPVLVGTLSGITNVTSLAYDTAANVLYARSSAGFYAVNTTTAVATQVYAATAQDFGGMEYDAANDVFYATNDSTSTIIVPGRGLYRIQKPLSAPTFTRLASYPTGDTDIDGLSVGNGVLYLINDTHAQPIYRFDIASGQYLSTIPTPFTNSGVTPVSSGGAWAPGLMDTASSADLAVTLSDAPDPVVPPGGALQYTITVTNNGPSSASAVAVDLSLPGGITFLSADSPLSHTGGHVTGNLGTMLSGEQRVLHVNIQTGGPTNLTAVVDVESVAGDPITGNNQAQATTVVRNVQADLGVTVTDPTDCTLTVGQSFSYVVTATNHGPEAAAGVRVFVILPTNASFLGSVPPLTPSAGVLTLEVGALGVNDSAQIEVFVQPTQPGVVALQVDTDLTTEDPNTANDGFYAPTRIATPPPTFASALGVYSTLLTHPTSLVPGMGGARFSDLGTIFRSPSGSRWILLADTDAPTTGDAMVLLGDGATGTIAARENTFPLLPTNPSNSFSPFTIDPVLAVTDGGLWAMSGIDNRPTVVDDGFVVVWNGVLFSLISQEGDPLAAMGPNVNFGALRGGVRLADSGAAFFAASLSGTGVAPGNDQGILAQNTAWGLARKGVTVPVGQRNGNGFAYTALEIGTTAAIAPGSDSSGTRFIEVASIADTANFDRVVVVDNAVVAQEGVPLPSFVASVANGSPFASARMEPTGDWFVIGSNSDGQDWVLRNGAVIARTTDEIVTGSGETWSQIGNPLTFTVATQTPAGGIILGGSTDEPDPLKDSVLVLNGTEILLRENDPIDLNADGLFNEDMFIRSFVPGGAFMTADGALFAMVQVRSGDAARCVGEDLDLGRALIRIAAPGAPCDGDVNCDFALDGFDVEVQERAVGGDMVDYCQADPDFNGDFALDGFDVEAVELVVGGGPCP